MRNEVYQVAEGGGGTTVCFDEHGVQAARTRGDARDLVVRDGEGETSRRHEKQRNDGSNHGDRMPRPNGSRLSCGALKKNSFLNLRAPPASSAC